MMKFLALTTITLLLCSFSTAGELAVGDRLPNEALPNQNGKTVHVADYAGKWLILYFYPKDGTSGCTREAITFSKLLPDFHAENAEVLGVNTDSGESHLSFIKKHDLKIDLLVDKDKKLINLFGVRTFLGFCSRDTVLINPAGMVEKIYRGVSPEGNPSDILSYIKEKNKQ